MYPKIKFVSVIVLLTLILQVSGSGVQALAIDGGVPANAPSLQDEGNSVMEKVVSPAMQKAALKFWTHEALADAQPMIMIDYGTPGVDQAASQEPEFVGEPGFSPAGAASPDADQIARAAYPNDWRLMEDESAVTDFGLEEFGPEGTSQVFTSYIVNLWAPAQTIHPHKYVGRVSFQNAGSTFYCSGTSISGNVMLTAAHCLYNSDTNQWYSGWVFTPAYRNGSAPYGSFAATNCKILTAYANLPPGFNINTWTKHDVGVCKMGNNSSGQTLNAAVGFMGRSWNASYIRHFHTLGYPFRNTSDVLLTNAGLYLRTCAAESFQQTTETRGMGCNFGGGISGGPWMVSYALNVAGGFADGVNSGIFIGTQNMYGARFNSSNIVALCTAIGC